MWVSKREYQNLLDRALRAEGMVDTLIARLNARPDDVHKTEKDAPEKVNDAYKEEDSVDLPPPVEDAIAHRARPGSSLEQTLRQSAGQAMLKGGRDFDAEAYARHIEVGTRIEGWPL